MNQRLEYTLLAIDSFLAGALAYELGSIHLVLFIGIFILFFMLLTINEEVKK